MKGYCKCGVVIDEVEYTQYRMCIHCYNNRYNIKHDGIITRRRKIEE